MARVPHERRDAMAYDTILQEAEGGVVRLTLNRPAKLNAFNDAMHAELADALSRMQDARVLVITGAGRAFCAGQDLIELGKRREGGPGANVGCEQRYERLVNLDAE